LFFEEYLKCLLCFIYLFKNTSSGNIKVLCSLLDKDTNEYLVIIVRY